MRNIIVATSMLMTVAVLPIAAAEWVDGVHVCGGDVDHECIYCPEGYTYNGDGTCTKTYPNGSTSTVPAQICAVYTAGRCV